MAEGVGSFFFFFLFLGRAEKQGIVGLTRGSM